MGLIKNENGHITGWEDWTCFSHAYDEEKKCQGRMQLKDINIKTRESSQGFEGFPDTVINSVILEKIWVCDNPACGELFIE